ncbi:MAG: alcohol dehydrogenase catalytic domain-containing protein [Deferribacteres bacterium]|nr:alcohol dehydrogenase catalytic domain-containing protein [Deferribacteres bacterium]
MRVLMYYNNNDVRVEEMPVPAIGPGEMLVKVFASGICGSDVMEWYRIKKAPRVLGHEIAGEVVEVGEGVEDYRKGDRVFVSHHVPCNTCRYCLKGSHTACETLHRTNYDPGGFSEYIRIPRINVERGVYRLPDEMSYEEATFIEPLACVVRGQRLARIKPGHTVLVIGSGISGLIHISLARALGAGRIMASDITEYRLRAAERVGADAVINAEEDVAGRLKELNEGRLADIVIVCAGALSASTGALKCVDRGGTVLYFAVPEPEVAVPVPMNDLWRNEITLMTSYGAGPLDIETALQLMKCRRIDLTGMITHRLGFDEGGLGFRLVAEAGDSIKVIFQPHKKHGG